MGLYPARMHGWCPARILGLCPARMHGLCPAIMHGWCPARMHGLCPVRMYGLCHASMHGLCPARMHGLCPVRIHGLCPVRMHGLSCKNVWNVFCQYAWAVSCQYAWTISRNATLPFFKPTLQCEKTSILHMLGLRLGTLEQFFIWPQSWTAKRRVRKVTFYESFEVGITTYLLLKWFIMHSKWLINKVSKSSTYIRLKYQIYAMMNYTDKNKMTEVKSSNFYSSHMFYRSNFFNKVNTKMRCLQMFTYLKKIN